jgi:hypothetical protein
MKKIARTPRLSTRIYPYAAACALLAACLPLQAAEDNDRQIGEDLHSGLALQAIADRAYAHAGSEQALSAAEAVSGIYRLASANPEGADPATRDIVQVTIAVINAWPDCQDTFNAVKAAVELMPERAGEIVAHVAIKRDCNCTDGGLWVDERVDERLRPEVRDAILEVPEVCSCSQIALYGGIAGLPENREFTPDLPPPHKAELINRMAGRVAAITGQTARLQSKNGWECACTDINIAASMQGIGQVELRDGVYALLPAKYAGTDLLASSAPPDEEMAQSCRAQSHAYVTHYPAQPFRRFPKATLSLPRGQRDIASPN